MWAQRMMMMQDVLIYEQHDSGLHGIGLPSCGRQKAGKMVDTARRQKRLVLHKLHWSTVKLQSNGHDWQVKVPTWGMQQDSMSVHIHMPVAMSICTYALYTVFYFLLSLFVCYRWLFIFCFLGSLLHSSAFSTIQLIYQFACGYSHCYSLCWHFALCFVLFWCFSYLQLVCVLIVFLLSYFGWSCLFDSGLFNMSVTRSGRSVKITNILYGFQAIFVFLHHTIAR